MPFCLYWSLPPNLFIFSRLHYVSSFFFYLSIPFQISSRFYRVFRFFFNSFLLIFKFTYVFIFFSYFLNCYLFSASFILLTFNSFLYIFSFSSVQFISSVKLSLVIYHLRIFLSPLYIWISFSFWQLSYCCYFLFPSHSLSTSPFLQRQAIWVNIKTLKH